MREDQTEVLIVGAGPVGLLSALFLTEAGVRVQIIDRENRTTTGSYACALHGQTLQLLDGLGLAAGVLERGRRVTKVRFFEGADVKSQADLSLLGGAYPFVLILPQTEFEQILERRLAEKGIHVHWNHRFDDLQHDRDTMLVTLEKLGGTSTGYIVPHWETVVQKRFTLRTRFIIGSDGHNSLVRQRLGIEFTHLSGPDFFAAYEFEADAPAADELRVVLDANAISVLWPMLGNKQRWVFQMPKSEITDFPDKERRAIRFEHKAIDENLRAYVQKVAARRAPWFKANIKEVTQSSDVFFGQEFVEQFGKGGCWLAGDSAHQTGPVGAQSMNIGMLEAESLTSRLAEIIRGRASNASLETYNAERQAEWNSLFGIRGGIKPKEGTDLWVKQRLSRVLPCLPASGADLAKLVGQLGADFQP